MRLVTSSRNGRITPQIIWLFCLFQIALIAINWRSLVDALELSVRNGAGQNIVGRKMFFLFVGTLVMALRASSWDRVLSFQRKVATHIDLALIVTATSSSILLAGLACKIGPPELIFPTLVSLGIQLSLRVPERLGQTEIRPWAIAVATVCASAVAVSWLAHWAERESEHIWNHIGGPVVRALSYTLNLMTFENTVVPEEFRISIRSVTLTIKKGCAGFQSASLVGTLFGGYLFIARPSNRRVSVPIGFLMLIGICVSLNFVRLFILSAIAGVYGFAPAFEGFHSALGWFLSAATFLGFVAWFERPVAEDPPAGPGAWTRPIDGPTFSFLAPLLAMAAASIACSGLASHVIGTYCIRIVAGCLAICLGTHVLSKALSIRDVCIGIGLGLVAFAVWMAFDRYSVLTGKEYTAHVEAAAPWFQDWRSTAIRMMGSGVVVPIAEELAFRGYLMRRITGGADFSTQAYNKTKFLGIALSAFAFGAGHSEIIAAVLCGIVFSLAAKWSNRLLPAIIAHSVCNLLIAASAVGLNQRHLWA